MCGIAGILLSESRPPGEIQHIVSSMCHAQQTRGPNNAGLWANGHVGLGNVRLAVTGETAGASQPLRDPQGGINVFNGEIYNASQLEPTVENMWKSPGFSDGRVLAGLLSQGGLDALNQTSGPFAIARFDPENGKLLLVRDAVGKKPLYLKKLPNGWAFASTIAALREACGPLVQRPQAIHEYLIYRSIGGNASAFEEVTQVPAGGWVEISINGRMRSGHWWTPPVICPSTEVNKDSIRTLITDATLVRHEEERPTAIFLSGGLDSSIIAAILANARPESNLVSLSIGYDTSGYEDETEYAAELANYVGLQHEQIRLCANEVPSLLDKAAWLTEDPIQDPVVIATTKLAINVAQWTNVALTGDGSDEIWGGYARFDNHPQTLEDYLPRCSIFSPGELGLKQAPESYLHGIISPPDHLPPLDRIFRLEVSNRMRNYHLARIDKVCMGVGLEPRSPFLDLKVVNEGLLIPAAVKRNNNNTPKGLLIDAFAPLLPTWMIKRKKQPFTVPISQWIPGALYDFTHDLLLSNNTFVGTFINPNDYLSQFKRGEVIKDALAHRIWSLLQIEVWHQGFAKEMGRYNSPLHISHNIDAQPIINRGIQVTA